MRGHEEGEATTRRLRINKRLEEAGWKIAPYEPDKPHAAYDRHALEEYLTSNGPADYALVAGGRVLGVLEGKRRRTGPRNVLWQASRYSKGVQGSPFNFDGFRVPFLYSSNGDIICHRDARHPMNLSRDIAAFHTPEALLEMMGRDHEREAAALAAMANQHPRLRPYQVDANEAVERAVIARKREMLLAMATGTGKTFTTVNEVYRLMKSGLARRVLFLVDRRALAAQAVQAFHAFDPEPGLKFPSIYEVYHQRFHREDLDSEHKFDPKLMPNEYLTRPSAKHAFVYVCTIQRMAINLLGRGAVYSQGDEGADDDAEPLDIPIHAFDFVIADECHRGYTTTEIAVWRKVLEHFDAVKLGLTATPAPHTKAYFKNIVYRYDYERAVREGYLVDYDPVKIKSGVRIDGVFLKEGEHIEVVDPESGLSRLDEVEDERHFDSAEIERRVTAPDSNRKIVQEIARYAAEHEQQTGRFPKTLIFAVNDLQHVSHCDQLVAICREVFGRGEEFVAKITGSPNVDRPLQRIREFRNRPNPGVVVTVDMLSTGVDIPDLEFLVFLRPVKSRILWEQMLGRGTRRGEHHPDKSRFVVFDCFDGTLLDYFKNASAFTIDPLDRPVRSVREVVEEIWNNRDRDFNLRCLIKRLHRIDKSMSADARTLFSAYVPDGAIGKFAVGLPRALGRDFQGTMTLLRDKEFQDLLEHYPRARSGFVVAHETEDTVSSEWLIRDGTGKEYKADDYLKAFEEFVAGHTAEIESLEILLRRPADWNPRALADLRDRLLAAPQRFTVENLQKVHQKRYDKALVDIISMVKLAAHREASEALTSAERVARAFERILTGHTFTDEQEKWLDRIREHMIVNLSIDPEDFDDVPIFAREGGWAKADQVFGGRLRPLLREFNREIAA
jgi:type I restriction enzyme R subunit